MYVAVNQIHGFADGNGRLSRFLLNWQAESANLPLVVIPLNMRTLAGNELDTPWYEGRLEPLMANIEVCCAETNELLKRFEHLVQGSVGIAR
jgi:hypothetical protein